MEESVEAGSLAHFQGDKSAAATVATNHGSLEASPQVCVCIASLCMKSQLCV